MSNDLHAIEKTIQTYFDGLYEGDTDKIASAFHEVSHLYTVGNDGTVIDVPRAQWLDGVRSRPSPKSKNLARHDRILSINMAGPEAAPDMATVIVNCQMPPRYFTDQLSLLKTGGKWRIVSKTFRTDMREK